MVYNSANVAGAGRARHARSQGQCALPNERWQAAAVEATTSLTTHLPAQIKGEIERTTRVAAWSAVQDRLLLVQRWQGTKIAELNLPNKTPTACTVERVMPANNPRRGYAVHNGDGATRAATPV